MTIRGQHGKHHLYFHPVAVCTVLAIIFTTAHTAAGSSADRTVKHKFELRLASHEKVEGWERVPGPGPENTQVWISPEVALTNRDVARTWPARTPDGKPCVGVLFTEEGTLKMARLTKSHIGELLAVILDGRVTMAPMIREEISRETMINGNFTEEETGSIAKELSGDHAWKPKFESGKHGFELRLASYQKVEGWKRVPGPEPQFTPVWISPEVALDNTDLASAWPQADGDGFSVGFMLTEDGALKLARLTKSHIGELLAIILDGRVESTPKIMAEITGGRAVINGKFTEAEAKALADGILEK